MARKDSKLRLQNETTFAQQLLPAVSAAAQIFQTLGVPFDTVAFLMRMARDMGIDWLDEVVYAPQIQQKSAMEYNKIQQATGQDVPGGAAQPNPGLNPAIQQNGQPGQVPGAQPTPQQGQNAGAQAGAQDAQRLIGSALRHSLNTPGPGRLATLPSQGGI
jgi:hypothetical protein